MYMLTKVLNIIMPLDQHWQIKCTQSLQIEKNDTLFTQSNKRMKMLYEQLE